MTATEIIQNKLTSLGYPVKITGVIGTTAQPKEATRNAVRMFKSANKIGNDIYIDADFLKKLDNLYITRFPSGNLKPSYYKGWNADLNIKWVGSEAPVAPPINRPDVKPIVKPETFEESKTPIIIDETKDNNMLYVGAVAVLAGLFFVMSGNKKKKRR